MTKNDEEESGKGREIEGGGRIDRSSRGKFSFAWMVFFFLTCNSQTYFVRTMILE